MEEKKKIRFRDFIKQKAIDYNLKPKPTKVFLAEFDLDKQNEGEKDIAKTLVMELNTYRRHKTEMYKQLGFRSTGYKREDFLRQLLKEFSASPSEQQRKRLEIEELNSQSQSLLSHDQLGALVAAVKAGRKLQAMEAPFDTRIRTLCRLWQIVYSVKERNRFEGHNGEVTSISFSPDGRKLASASEDGTVRIWNLDGTLLKTLKNTDSFIKVWDVKFSANSKTLASADERGRVVLWDLDHCNGFPILEHDTEATSVSFTTDGEMLASGDCEGMVKLWSLKVGELESCQLSGDCIHSISFINSQMLAVAIDNKVKLLILNDTELESFSNVETYGVDVVSVSFSSDGQTLASASWVGTVGLWNQNSDRTIRLPGSNISSISLSPNGQRLASAGNDGIVRLWDLEGRELQTFRGHTNIVNRVSFSPVGETLASASADGSVRLWSLKGNKLQTLQGHSKCVTHVSFSPNGQMLASASDDNTVKLWNLDGTELQTFQATYYCCSGVRFSSDSRMLVFASDLKTVEFWSTDHNKQLLFKIPIPKDCFSMSLSPDGQRYAQRNYNKGTVTVYNSMDGTLIKSIPSKSKPMSFSPNGKVLALNGENGIVELWNLDSGEMNTFQAHTNVVESVAFSSDRQMLAYASEDGTLRLWKIDGTPQQIFQRHSSYVTSVCFSPDGQMLASASEDGTVRLWSINGGVLHTFHGHSCPVYSVAFSPDGQMLASADLDGTIILWNLNLEDLLKRGCDWLRDYLKTNPNVSESDRYLCDGY